MPYVKRYVQVLPSTLPNATTVVTHNLSNTDIASVEINTDDLSQPVIPFTWQVANDDQILITSSVDLNGCWIVVRAA